MIRIGNSPTIVTETLIEQHAHDGRYLTIRNALKDLEWNTISSFECVWRWLLSGFGIESTVSKCRRISIAALQLAQPTSEVELLQSIRSIAGVSGSLKNRLVGTVFGQAVGDAIGVTTEFMDKKSAQAAIALGPLEYSTRHTSKQFRQIEMMNVQDRFHWRLNFPFNGWTDDTDQAIGCIRALEKAKKSKAKTAQQLFAQELQTWIKDGLSGRNFSAQKGGRENPTFTTPTALGLGGVVGRAMGILPRKDQAAVARFLANPKQSAIEAWNDPALAFKGDKPAANGALMRTGPIAAMYVNNYDEMWQHTIEMCEVTHVDPRCVASCVAATTAIFYMLHGETSLDVVRAKAYEAGAAILAQKIIERGLDSSLQAKYETQLNEAVYSTAYEPLHLDDYGRVSAIGGTFQCLGAAFATLFISDQYVQSGALASTAYRESITKLVGEGGDADTNAAIAASMLGSRWGFSAIPESWQGLRDQNVLLSTIQMCM